MKYIFLRSSDVREFYFLNFGLTKRFGEKNTLLFKNCSKFGIKLSKNTLNFESNLYKNFFSINFKNINFKKKIFLISKEKFLYNKTSQTSKQISKKNLLNFFENFSFNSHEYASSNSLKNLFDINFLRKEKIYTKLKYSRVPQYDIVSGGVAALFAGFLGFLICEKFGFELLDSGDFYVLFMYCVFLNFFIKMFLNLCTLKDNNWSIFSFKWFISFYKTIFNVILNYVIKFFK